MLKHLLSLIESSRKDPGCLNYDLHHSQEDPASFLFHENWLTRQHLDQHLAKPDLQATLAELEPLVAEPPQISLWEKIA